MGIYLIGAAADRPGRQPQAGREGGRTVKRAAALSVLTAAIAGCATTTTSTHHAAAAAATKTTAPAVPAYVARLEGDGYTLDGSCALHGAQGIGQAWGDDGSGNGELLMEAKTSDFAATLAASMNAFASAAGNGSSVTIAVSDNYVVITGPASATGPLGQAGC